MTYTASYINALQFIKEVQALGVPISVNITMYPDTVLVNDEPTDEGGDQASAVEATIAGEKALARCAAGHNAKGFPIMAIFPNDSAPVSQRIRFTSGHKLLVYPEPVKADGGGMFYELVEVTQPETDEPLYLRAQDIDL